MQNKVTVNNVVYIAQHDEDNTSCRHCAAFPDTELCNKLNNYYDCFEQQIYWTVDQQPQQQNLDQGEILDIMQEECAEVIQAVSKVRRFGAHNHHPERQQTNQEELEEEVGDLLAMIDLLYTTGLLRRPYTTLARQAKTEKLRRYSKVYK